MDDLIRRQDAVEALIQEFYSNVDDYISEKQAVHAIDSLPSAQPESCEDTVSRQRLLNDLKELITAWKKYPVMAKQIKGVEAAIEYVKAIPSADRPKGEWTQNVFRSDIYRYECSNCKAHHRARYDYCPSCGARMKGADDE